MVASHTSTRPFCASKASWNSFFFIFLALGTLTLFENTEVLLRHQIEWNTLTTTLWVSQGAASVRGTMGAELLSRRLKRRKA